MSSEQIWRIHKGYPNWDDGWEVDRDPDLGILWQWSNGAKVWREHERIV